MVTLDDLNSRCQVFNVKLETLRGVHNKTVESEAVVKAEIARLKAAMAVLHFCAQEINREVELETASLASLALQETFWDQDLVLEVEHTTLRGKPAVVLKLKDKQSGVSGDPLESFGGGPASLLGLVLQVITILKNPKLSRVLLLDEPLSQISERYRESAGKLLAKLCQPVSQDGSGGLGFKMLVVTHSPSITRAANRNYLVSKEDGVSRVVLAPPTIS